jgi:hypothetical protein
LKFSSLRVVEDNFDSLKKSSYGPKVDSVPMSGGNAVFNSAGEVVGPPVIFHICILS